MTLVELIRKREPGEVATAISAIPAIPDSPQAPTVARIATVAVANPGSAGIEDHTPTAQAAAQDQRLNLSRVSPEFAARLSAEGLDDIAAGDITLGTVQAFEEAAIAREGEDLREFFEERAAILEYDAGLPRPQAELEAARITATLARNRGYLWASLRAALAGYPVLLCQVPDTPGPVDALPLGVTTLAVLSGRRVVRQGAFAGGYEVKA